MNAKAESVMKTLKVEAIYPMAFETLRRRRTPSPLHRGDLQQGQAPFGARLSEPEAVRGSTLPADWQISSTTAARLQGRTPPKPDPQAAVSRDRR